MSVRGRARFGAARLGGAAWMASGSALFALALLALGVGGLQEAPFPHADHEGLFPLCTGCHEGVPLGDSAAFYPQLDSCAGCHDGVEEDVVVWEGPSPAVDNVQFDHVEHTRDLAEAGDPQQDCATCHNEPGDGRLSVAGSVQLSTCLTCHAHEAADHYVDSDCASCHMELAGTGFGLTRIEALPVPVDHESAAFAGGDHGMLADRELGRCATCHTQERCVSCHVDVERDAISLLPSAPPDMELPSAVAHYNEPSTHGAVGFADGHGSRASRAECATCHTSDDCLSCHVQPAPEPIDSFPSRAEATAPGVRLAAELPDNHDSYFFMDAHASLAGSDQARCATCHVESYCVDCHDGPVGSGYHPEAFVARHAATAFSADAECANCHRTEVFCRQCHAQAGLVGPARSGPEYHDGGPLWLLRHAQPARQNLESCVSCHEQNDCTRCHGALGAFKVSPHGRDFDAERGWARSPRACLGCHIRNPLGGA